MEETNYAEMLQTLQTVEPLAKTAYTRWAACFEKDQGHTAPLLAKTAYTRWAACFEKDQGHTAPLSEEAVHALQQAQSWRYGRLALATCLLRLMLTDLKKLAGTQAPLVHKLLDVKATSCTLTSEEDLLFILKLACMVDENDLQAAMGASLYLSMLDESKPERLLDIVKVALDFGAAVRIGQAECKILQNPAMN